MSPSTPKAARTREAILETALALFQSRGYEKTTMRDIAKRLKMSVGAAYYYFKSKDDIVMAFYLQIQDEQSTQAEAVFQRERDFSRRMKELMRWKLESMKPYRAFMGGLFARAADPESALSPFSENTRDIREASVTVFSSLLDDAGLKLSDEMRAALPRLLWLFHMGVILYWLHDRSEDQKKTYKLMERGVDLIGLFNTVIHLPLMGKFRQSLLSMLNEAGPATATA